ncbi:hypothetical protein Cni_G15098 [Canna indica]|uniref:Uncharacterized protein n=1 Tax=Canna indica TaxID=4628 RepID=A0AAQ3QB91_9LILI|nr:hypothetical protein Cni_G15098 [Canna indica]
MVPKASATLPSPECPTEGVWRSSANPRGDNRFPSAPSAILSGPVLLQWAGLPWLRLVSLPSPERRPH